MTLDEAIKHAEEVAEEKENDAEFFKANPVLGKVLADAKECKRCAAEHRQLAEWLKELKERRAKDERNC